MRRIISLVAMLHCIAVISNAEAQLISSDSLQSFETLIDPEETSLSSFHSLTLENFGSQLQFLQDEFERIAFQHHDLRNTSWQDLLQIPLFNSLDVADVVRAHQMDSVTLEETSPVMHYYEGNHSSSRGMGLRLRTRMEIDPNVSSSQPYQSHYYHGSPVKTSTRVMLQDEHYVFAITEAKDAGEPLFFDHLSASFAINAPLTFGKVLSMSKLVLGDYSLSYGNGLLFANGFFRAPVSDLHSLVTSHSSGMRPYASISSFQYFRGAGLELTSGPVAVSGFYSDKEIDAKLDSLHEITYLSNTGYHRSAVELGRRNTSQTRLLGGNVAFTQSSDNYFLQLGLTGYSLHYENPVLKTDSNGATFFGENHRMISVNVVSVFWQCAFTGELARMISDVGNATAFSTSLLMRPIEQIELALNYRSLPRTYISPFGSTFGINTSDAQNENGWLLGAKIFLIPNACTLYSSMNIARSISPSRNEVQYADNRVGCKYEFATVPVVFSAELRNYGKGPLLSQLPDSISRNSLKLDCGIQFSRNVEVKLRAEFQKYHTEQIFSPQSGSLLGIKTNYFFQDGIRLSTGIAFFRTDSYSSRFYSNESDLPGAIPIVPLSGNGYRYFLLASYVIAERIRLTGRVAQTHSTPMASSNTSIGFQCDLSL
ncbi:MAG: hypothetical protein WCH46_04340 [bacterium]